MTCNEAFQRMGFAIRWSWEEFKELLKIPGNARRMRLAPATAPNFLLVGGVPCYFWTWRPTAATRRPNALPLLVVEIDPAEVRRARTVNPLLRDERLDVTLRELERVRREGVR